MDLLLSQPQATLAADVLKAVAHPLRLRLLVALCDQPRNVSGLAELLEVPQAIVSQQLRILRMQQLVGVTRADGLATYRLTEPHLRDLLQCLTKCVCGRGGTSS